MTDDQNNQSKNPQTQQNKPVEDRFNVNPGPSSGIRSSLLSSQVNSKPLVDEGVFAKPEQHQVPATEVVSTRKINSKLMGLVAVLCLLFLAGAGLFFAYASYRSSYNKIQNSKLSNSVDTTAVDLGGLTPTSSTLQGVGLLQVNGDANITNNVTANSFSGGGADLTNLNATNITSGTLNDARLSSNVALLDANQTFTGSNTFTGAVVLPGTLVINSLTYNMPTTQAAGTLTNDGSGNLTWNASGACPVCVVNGGNAFGSTVIIGSTDAQSMNLITNGVTRVSFDTTGNATFSGTINGNGSGITNLNASNVSSGTLNDARLSTNVTLAGNIFNGALQLVQLDGAGALPALNGSALTNLNATNITAGTLNDLRLSSNVTLQGNTFNVANKLVQLTAASFYPAINGSLITNLNASNLASGTVSDSRLSANVALLNANQTFSGNNTFSGTVTAGTITTTAGLTVGSTTQALTLQGNSSTTLTSTNAGSTTTVSFVAPTANVTYRFDTTSAGTYDICTSAGNCAGGGGAVTTLGGTSNKLAKFTGLLSIGDSSITDTGTQVTIQPSADGTSAVRVLNAAGSTTALNVDTTNTRLGVGTATPSYPLDVVGDINSSTGLRVGGTLVCDNTGCVGSGGSGFYIQNGTAIQSNANFAFQSAAAGSIGGVIRGAAAQTADLQQWQNSGAAVVAYVDASGNINTTGQFKVGGVQISSANLSNDSNLAKLNGTQIFTGVNTFQNTVDSTSAFRIQNAAGSSNLLIADTTNTRIGIGTGSPGYTMDVNGDLNIAAGNYFRIGGTPICGPTASCAPSSGSSSYIQNTTTQQSNANFNIQSINSASIVGVLQGTTGQTANLLELRSGAGNTVVQFANSGALTLGNDIASPNAGSVVFNDGTGLNGFTSTLSTATLNANRGISLPDENGTICLQNSLNCGFASSSAGTGYIQNQSASAQSANFWIDGTGRLATSVLTPSVDVISAGTLSVGNTTATALTLGKSGITTTNSGALTVSQLLTGNLGLTVTGAAVSLNDSSNFGVSIASGSSTGQVDIGAGASASTQALNFGTGGSIKNVTVGSTNTTSATTINGGDSGSITMGSLTGNTTIDLKTGNNTASAINIQSGNSSTITVQTGTSGTIELQAQTVNIAKTTGNKTIDIATSTGVNTISVGGTGANTITIGNTQTAGSIAMGNAMTTGTIALGGSAMTTGTITLRGGTGAGALSLQANSGGTILIGTVNNNAITTGTGVLTVAGNANLNGNTTIGNATTDRLTVTSQILGASPLAFQGATDDGFTTTFAITDPTVNNTVTFRNGSGTVCFEGSANCGFQASGNYFAQGGNSFATTATLGTNDANSLVFETGGATRFTIDAAASTLTGSGATTLTAGSTMTINSAGASALTIDSGTTGGISIGTGANAKALTFGNTSVNSSFTFNSGASTTTAMTLAANSVTSGTALSIAVDGMTNSAGKGVDISSSSSTFAGTLLKASTSSTSGSVNSTNGFVYFQYAGGTRNNSFVQIDDKTTGNGSALVLNAGGTSAGTGSTAAFIVQNWNGNIKPLTVDTTNNNIIPGGGIAFTKETAHTISVSQSTTAATAGAALSIVAGQGSSTTSGAGGQLNLTGGAASAGNSSGGAVVITGGVGVNLSAGGAVSLIGGVALTGGAASVTGGAGIQGGAASLAGGAGSTSPAGSVSINGGNASSTGAGGSISITGGTSSGGTPGNITMTTTTSTTNAFTLTANSSIGGVAATINSTSASRTGAVLSLQGTGSDNASIIVADSNGTCNGNPGAAAFAWSCSSDVRLKDNIVNSQSILNALSSVQIRAFDWKSDGSHVDYGVIAQELEGTALSWLVSTNPETGLKSVREIDPWMLTKGLQEVNSRVTSLESAVNVDVLQQLASANAITINGTLTINGRTIFNNEVSFDQDTAGDATILTGDTTKHINFSKTLSKKPVVNATPQDFIDGGYKVMNVTTTGFDIVLQNAQTSDVIFSWQALISQ